MKTGRLVLILVIVVVLGLVIRKLFFGKEEITAMKGGTAPPPPVLSGYVVTPVATESNINASGTLFSSEEVMLRPETSGKITALHIREGMSVSKGELLVKINDDDLAANQRKLRSRYELAQQRLARQKSLLDAKAIGQEEYDIHANEVSVLEADLDYNAALIRKTEIRAPFSGRVGLRNVSEGSFVTPATEIAVIQQIHPLKLDFSIPERYAGRIRLGDPVHFTIDGFEEEFSARLYAVEPRIDPATRTLKMRAAVSNTSGKLYPGTFARVSYALGKSDALLVPTQAVIPILKGKKVFVVKSGMAVTREIITGERSAVKVEVLKGLAPGDTVITSGIMQLRDSMQVRIQIRD